MGIIDINEGGPIQKACVKGGFQTNEKCHFRDSAIYIQSDADGYLTLVADTGIKLNAPSVKVYDAAITVGAFTATSSTINVAVQINQGDNSTAVAEAVAFDLYLSSDSAGQTVDAAPSGGFAVGTDGTIITEHVANVYAKCITEADGDFDIDLVDTAAAATYVNVVLPSGQIVTSSALSFA